MFKYLLAVSLARLHQRVSEEQFHDILARLVISSGTHRTSYRGFGRWYSAPGGGGPVPASKDNPLVLIFDEHTSACENFCFRPLTLTPSVSLESFLAAVEELRSWNLSTYVINLATQKVARASNRFTTLDPLFWTGDHTNPLGNPFLVIGATHIGALRSLWTLRKLAVLPSGKVYLRPGWPLQFSTLP